MPKHKGKSNDLNEKNRQLVGSIYSGAFNPSSFNDIFKAWDDHFEALGELDERLESEDFQWTDEFIFHFEKAGQFLKDSSSENHRPLRESVDEMPFAALLCSLDGAVLAANALARNIKSLSDISSWKEVDFDPQSKKTLASIIENYSNTDATAMDAQVVVRIHVDDADEPELFLAKIVKEASEDGQPDEAVLLFRSITVTWDESVGRALVAAFQLTKAELNLTEHLYRGLSIKEIAQWKNRSEATLRTQLSSILQKTGTKSQSDLSRIVSGLVQILRQPARDSGLSNPTRSHSGSKRQNTDTVTLNDGTRVQVFKSGDLDGIPFYFIQTTTQPVLTEEIISALASKNICMISPCRSGLGETSLTATSVGPAQWAHYHLEVMERLEVEPAYLGGHCSGGVYALALARLLAGRCKSVLLVDVGAPLASAAMINQMPTSPKRLFLAARYFPIALRTPYRLVTSDFYRGLEGEKRLVSYFYDGSPTDEAIVEKGNNWQITRDNIDYCLQNPLQAIQDVRHWSLDHTSLLEEVARNSHVRYFHGEDNFVHRADNVRKLCRTMPNTSCSIEQDMAQLLIYEKPARFADEIAKLVLEH